MRGFPQCLGIIKNNGFSTSKICGSILQTFTLVEMTEFMAPTSPYFKVPLKCISYHGDPTPQISRAILPIVNQKQGTLVSCGVLVHKKRQQHKRILCGQILMSFLPSQKKPYSSVTVSIEQLTSEHYEEDDLSGIPDLVEAVKIQATGPSEAARAIRKKLKYGNVHRQLRALTILDGLIQNAGPRFQRAFADEPLLERLRVCGTSDLSEYVFSF